MRFRPVGRSGLRVSEIGLGSWLTLGSSVDRSETARLVHSAFDRGINFFDTADVYAEGAAETALGEALFPLPRPQVVIATKAFFPMSQGANDRGLSRKHLYESVEGSLRRLRTDYLDLHQCHRSDPEVPLEETVRAYEDLIRAGKLLYWGISEWTGGQIAEALRVVDACRAYRPISNQPRYSLLHREIERELLPRCSREGIGQVVWGALAQGVLTGKYRGGTRPPGSRGADGFRSQFMADLLTPDTMARVELLRSQARELGVSMAQLALAWCLRQPGIASVIVGATAEPQLEDNAAASGLAVPDSVWRALDAAFPVQPAPDPG